MNILTLVLAVMAGGLQIGEDSAAHEVSNEQKCITAERISKPIANWKVLSTDLKSSGRQSYLVVSLHNPLNKTVDFVDAEFILLMDKTAPADSSKYNLMIAIFHNPKALVTFRRIYSIHPVKVKNKTKQFPMQTPCFAREINPIIQVEPIIIHSNPSTQPNDGGVQGGGR